MNYKKNKDGFIDYNLIQNFDFVAILKKEIIIDENIDNPNSIQYYQLPKNLKQISGMASILCKYISFLRYKDKLVCNKKVRIIFNCELVKELEEPETFIIYKGDFYGLKYSQGEFIMFNKFI
jgi:hypothetical protein